VVGTLNSAIPQALEVDWVHIRAHEGKPGTMAIRVFESPANVGSNDLSAPFLDGR
jgi:hypothetical protein